MFLTFLPENASGSIFTSMRSYIIYIFFQRIHEARRGRRGMVGATDAPDPHRLSLISSTTGAKDPVDSMDLRLRLFLADRIGLPAEKVTL